MSTIAQQLAALFEQATLKAFPNLKGQTIPFELVQSTQEKFGHYQWNTALKLSKLLGISPRQIAEQTTQNLDDHTLIDKLEIAGPGFINITLKADFLSALLNKAFRDPHLGIPFPNKKERVIIDFSSPNTAKEMHVGHLRSTIIGDCLAHLFEYLGHDVLRLNHIGDWGTAFGMLIAYMKKMAPDILSGKQQTDLSKLADLYKQSKKLFDEDPVFKKASQLEVVALQSGSPEARKAWEIICKISSEAYQTIYDTLSVKLIERGESFYNAQLPWIVADLQAKGLLELSDGAKCLYIDGFLNREGDPLPLIIQKADGGYNYDTTDMAAIYQRIHEEKGTQLIYVTDAGQATHFAMIFKAAEKAGYLQNKQVKVNHVPFGLVLGPDGKKFRTRAGDTEKLIDLLTAAVDKAQEILAARPSEMTTTERTQLAQALGINAIKYADLSCHRAGDYTFSYERMLRFDGNTAAFIMYSYVRVAGIKRRVNKRIEEIQQHASIELKHYSEIALGIHLLQFGEVLHQMTVDFLPHRLTDYLYLLAEKFNAFFRDCRVEGDAQENSRLLLCEITALVLAQGMKILGLSLVEKM